MISSKKTISAFQGELYLQELAIASAAAQGTYQDECRVETSELEKHLEVQNWRNTEVFECFRHASFPRTLEKEHIENIDKAIQNPSGRGLIFLSRSHFVGLQGSNWVMQGMLCDIHTGALLLTVRWISPARSRWAF